MDIYEFAMQMEKDGEIYYRELASKTSHPGLKAILGMLADAKAKHHVLFKCMKEHGEAKPTESPILDDAKSIFAQMREAKQTDVDISEIELYRKAQDLEKKAMELYRSKADQVGDLSQKTAFLKIARAEEKHFRVLEQIIDFVSRPDYWLENPEWYHLEEY